MKKYFISGVLAIAISAVFTGCSKSTDLYDEGAQQAAKDAKAQADLVEMYASYQTNFVKTFGAIAPGHKWGFDQTAVVTTRGAVTDSEISWFIPENFRTPNQNKEGIRANTIAAALQNGQLTKTLDNFNFNNFWLQHVEQPEHKNGVGQLQAYEAGKGWVDVDNFTNGKNNSFFDCEGINSYINQNALHCTTLMTGMGSCKDSDGNQFRYEVDGEWCYDYYFFTYGGSTFLCLKRYYAKKEETSWWIIRIAEAVPGDETLYRGRVLCEDMGEIGDYDFNDVVFDAEITKNNDIEITVVAAGGILPIYIGGSPEEGGIKVDMGTMVNTGEHNGVNPQTITFKAVNGAPKFPSIHAIPVWVDPGGEAIPYELKAEDGQAPQKICTYKLTAYPDEYIRIDNAYNGFAEWVNTQNPQKWSQHVNPWLVDLDLTNN